MSESVVLKKIMIAMSRVGGRVFRNNVGFFKTVDGRFIATGLCSGSTDLIGWTSIIITPEMVGKKIAVFTAIEAKKEDFKLTKSMAKHIEHQINFIETVKKAGGISGMVRCEKELIDLLPWAEISLDGSRTAPR
jgi:hypothetical protein